ncbi:hypothetical protein VF14_26890 [Nostoc linckia z18]|uniref:Uncharacterized protein n=2 Tax=Nostoc linckia TaxID=92942 RepID=A0A9Q6EJN1_NOSLI|nr:hypothetical protein VF02_16705 [Nostoc linckia z1]PHJ66619.1 hypothetical protein VF05_18980 [Nostoc linckia z3]PHJ72740.1 hypothetical protein VF03_18080 [Nostoc linckia z2]PHJ80918.1 hypothetical protein VF06_21270 [Nostoc linckia z4]PHJ87271.1 hypothetical protein VF07_21170 [Nostoc linckia z6]PHJ95159.1 hypothetical protein VF04_20090 [Nostoc linckia z7]PHK00656.1 hypothetical protein VF08_23620 [Nostoc linckia z8]PHK04688.1 hypothetical protein VF09_28025 [Nostoc linckia z9]PHK1674
MLNLEKLIKELGNLGEYLLSLLSTFIAYYDDLYGYPWGRIQLIGILCLGFGFYLGLINLILESPVS